MRCRKKWKKWITFPLIQIRYTNAFWPTKSPPRYSKPIGYNTSLACQLDVRSLFHFLSSFSFLTTGHCSIQGQEICLSRHTRRNITKIWRLDGVMGDCVCVKLDCDVAVCALKWLYLWGMDCRYLCIYDGMLCDWVALVCDREVVSKCSLGHCRGYVSGRETGVAM